MKKIKLSSGAIALIDSKSFELIKNFNWFEIRIEKLSYVATNVKLPNGKSTMVLMHRIILGNPIGGIVDHKNGNGLDNRIKNLRLCTHAQNMANRRMHKNNTSGYRGVSWDKKRKKWKACINKNGKTVHLGFSVSKELAAKIYDRAAIINFGEFSRLNFN